MKFEEKIQKLEQIVESLESSDVELSELLLKYEEGMLLINELKTYIENAEQKVQLINQASLEKL